MSSKKVQDCFSLTMIISFSHKQVPEIEAKIPLVLDPQGLKFCVPCRFQDSIDLLKWPKIKKVLMSVSKG